MIFVGVDWAEAHHDVFVEDGEGKAVGCWPSSEGVDGIARFHDLVGTFVEDPAEVVIGIETDRGLFRGGIGRRRVPALRRQPRCRRRAIGTAIRQVAPSPTPGMPRCSPTWSAPTVTTTGHVAGDSDNVEAIKVLARAHQTMVWSRGRQVNLLPLHPSASSTGGSCRIR